MSVSKKDDVKVDLDSAVRGIDDSRTNGRRCLTRLELVLLCAVTIFILGLLLLPIILYQIPVERSQSCNSDGHLADEKFNDNHSISSTSAVTGEHAVTMQHISDCTNITCQEGFYCKEQGSIVICSPGCTTWMQSSRSTNIAVDFAILLAECIGVVSGIAIFVVAGLRWRKVLTFPSSFVVYQTIPTIVLSVIVIISYMDDGTLYCSSKDLQQSLRQPTGFCTFTGVISYYCFFQLAVLWFCHLVALFWKVKFPLQARSFQKDHRMKYIHITFVAIGILVPVIPVVATISQFTHGKSSAEAVKGGLGFGITRFPPLMCTGKHGNTIFYSFTVPSVVMVMIGIALMASLFWIIHNHHGLFSERQGKSRNTISAAERKALIVFVYYVIVTFFILLGLALNVRYREYFLSEILCYFRCESKGVDPDNPCDASGFMNRVTLTMTSIAYVLLGLFPLVNFLFVVNVRLLKQHLEKWLPCQLKRPRKEKKASSSVTPNQDTTSTNTL